MRRRKRSLLFWLLCAVVLPSVGFASEGASGNGGLNLGEILPIYSGVPFAGMLLSIALMPLLFPRFWHHHFGKVSAFWAGAVGIRISSTQRAWTFTILREDSVPVWTSGGQGAMWSHRRAYTSQVESISGCATHVAALPTCRNTYWRN